jgi:hypothetical protein
MGMSGGGSQATLKKRIEQDNINISHFNKQSWNKGFKISNINKEK